jgi:hypothetical protein
LSQKSLVDQKTAWKERLRLTVLNVIITPRIPGSRSKKWPALLRDLRYDETELNTELYASNGDTSVTQDLYCYVQELQQFGSALTNFPSSLSSEVRLNR